MRLDATRLLLDVDTGTDDTGALWCAATHPDFALVATSSGWGNVGRDQTVRNTLAVLDAFGVADRVAVHPGAAGPVGPPAVKHGAELVMGNDGLGDCGVAPPAALVASDETGADAIVRLAREQPGDLTLVAVAPLSTVAEALAMEPALPQLVRALVVMGGAIAVPGNVSDVAEANIGHDPEAACVVANAFAGKQPRPKLVPLDVTLAAPLTPAELAAVAASPLPGATVVHHIWSAIWPTGSVELGHETDCWPCHDLTAIWTLVDPDAFEWRAGALVVDPTTGATSVGAGDGWSVAVGIDSERHRAGVQAWLEGSA